MIFNPPPPPPPPLQEYDVYTTVFWAASALAAMQARSGGLQAPSPGEVLVVEGTPGPNSADAILAVLVTEAFLTSAVTNNDQGGNDAIDTGDLPAEISRAPVDGVDRALAADGAATVLVGRDAVMQDLIDIGVFNGVRVSRIPDLPHDRARPPRRGRNIPRQNRLKKNTVGYTRVPLGRRS